MRRELVMACLVVALGCGTSPGPGQGNPDAGDAGNPADGGSVRAMLPPELMGTLSPENRVLNPEFSPHGDVWRNAQDVAEVKLVRVERPDSPTRTTVLRGSGRPLSVYGQFRGGPGPLNVSIWLGLEGVEPTETNVIAAAIGLMEGEEKQVRLKEEASSLLERDGVKWKRFAASMPSQVHGFGFLQLQPRASVTGPLYLNGPSVVRAGAPPAAMRAFPRVEPQPATDEQRAFLERAARR